jgi:DNA-binding MarR family transcriptional regulator
VKYGSVILALQRATHATLHLVHGDLTPSEVNALGNLADGRARTVSELGADIGSKPATLTGILDRLERRGLIERGAHAGDRRAVVITLTAEGVRAADAIHQRLAEVERAALAHLDPHALDGFHAVVDALTTGSHR